MKHTRKKGGQLKRAAQTLGKALTRGSPGIISSMAPAAERSVFPKFSQMGLRAASTLPIAGLPLNARQQIADISGLRYLLKTGTPTELTEAANSTIEQAASDINSTKQLIESVPNTASRALIEYKKPQNNLAVMAKAKTQGLLTGLVGKPGPRAIKMYNSYKKGLQNIAKEGEQAIRELEKRRTELLERGDTMIRRRLIGNAIMKVAKTRKNIQNARAALKNLVEPVGPTELFPVAKNALGLTPAERALRAQRALVLEEPAGPSNILPLSTNALGLTPAERALRAQRASQPALEEPAGPSNILPLSTNALGLTPSERALRMQRVSQPALEEPSGPTELFPNMAKPNFVPAPLPKPIAIPQQLALNVVPERSTALTTLTTPISGIKRAPLMEPLIKPLERISRINNTSILSRAQPSHGEIMYPLTTEVKQRNLKVTEPKIINAKFKVIEPEAKVEPEQKPKEEEKPSTVARAAVTMVGPNNSQRIQVVEKNNDEELSHGTINEYELKVLSYNVEHAKCKTGCIKNIVKFLMKAAEVVDVFILQNATNDVTKALGSTHVIVQHESNPSLLLAYAADKLKLAQVPPLFGTLESGQPFMMVAFTHMTIINVNATKDDMTYLASSIEELLGAHDGEMVRIAGIPAINVVEEYAGRLEGQHLILAGDFGMSPSNIPMLKDDNELTADLYYLKDENTGGEGLAFMGTILNGFNKSPTCCYPVYKKNRRLVYNVDQILTTFPDITVKIAEGSTNKDDMSSHVAVVATIKVGLQARPDGIGFENASVREPTVAAVVPPKAAVRPPPKATAAPPKAAVAVVPPKAAVAVAQPKIRLPAGIYRMDFIRHGLGCRALSSYIADSGLPPRLLTDALRMKAEGIDPLLADTGLLQAVALRRALSDKPYKAVFTSPLRRAIETALIVFGPRDVAIAFIPEELRTPGLIQGMTERAAGVPTIYAVPYLSEVRARKLGIRTRTNIDNESIGPAELEAWLGPHASAITIRPHATETEFNVIGFLNELGNIGINDNESSYAVVTHGNAMRSIYKSLGATEPLEDRRPYPTELWPMLVDIPGRSVLRYYSAPILPPAEYRLDRKSVTRDRLKVHGSRCRWVRALKGGRRTRRMR